MKNIIAIFLVSILLFGGCVSMPTQQQLKSLDYGPPPQEGYEDAVKSNFEDLLFDPHSAEYRFGKPRKCWMKDSNDLYAGYLVPVSVNAKNRFGGYVGFEQYAAMLSQGRVVKILDRYTTDRVGCVD